MFTGRLLSVSDARLAVRFAGRPTPAIVRRPAATNGCLSLMGLLYAYYRHAVARLESVRSFQRNSFMFILSAYNARVWICEIRDSVTLNSSPISFRNRFSK